MRLEILEHCSLLQNGDSLAYRDTVRRNVDAASAILTLDGLKTR